MLITLRAERVNLVYFLLSHCLYVYVCIIEKTFLFVFVYTVLKNPGNSNSEGEQKTVRVSGKLELLG